MEELKKLKREIDYAKEQLSVASNNVLIAWSKIDALIMTDNGHADLNKLEYKRICALLDIALDKLGRLYN